ncbi:MAG: hypothetical protein ACOVO2_02275 [Emticicia sp.]|uniref:hypothetical protein n=1 Tax=Emticicia sp. TaxID=1930953 RepID=UPI003BA6F5A5
MKNIVFISILALSLACQSKKGTTQKEVSSDTKATAITQNVDNTEELVTFGFSNENGEKILAFEDGISPKELTQTIDNNEEITPIKFLKTQLGNEKGINLVAQNIDNCKGQLFSMLNGDKVNPNETVVLFNYNFAVNHKPVLLKKIETPLLVDEKIKLLIAKDKNRKVKQAWEIAHLAERQKAFLVIFEPKKDSVLASLVISGTSYIYRDYPAKFDEGSTWRVDDGGQFPNDAIKIIGAFMNSKNELEIIIDWAGAEGANIEYAKANKNKFETIKEASRYWGAM